LPLLPPSGAFRLSLPDLGPFSPAASLALTTRAEMGTVIWGLSYLLPMGEKVGRLMVKVLVDLWRKKWKEHIAQAVRKDSLRIVAHEGDMPYLQLLVNLVNGSLANTSITRLGGNLYAGRWRFAGFYSEELALKRERVGYPWLPVALVSETAIAKNGGTSQIEVTLFPPIEFWLKGVKECSLRDAFVEVKSSCGSVRIDIAQDDVSIENVLPSYRNIIQDQLRSLR